MSGIEKRNVVPKWHDNALSHDFAYPALDGSENERVSNLPGAHNGFESKFQRRHFLKGEPKSITGRRFTPDQDMSFKLLAGGREHHVDFASLEPSTKIDPRGGGNFNSKAASVVDVYLHCTVSIHCKVFQPGVREEWRAGPKVNPSQSEFGDIGRLLHSRDFLHQLCSDEIFHLRRFVHGQEDAADHCIEPSCLQLLLGRMELLNQQNDVVYIELLWYWRIFFDTLLLIFQNGMIKVLLFRGALREQKEWQ